MDGMSQKLAEGFVVEIVSRRGEQTVFFLRRLLGTPVAILALITTGFH
ncbi:MAG TPA: hypothetical protein VGI36_17975 [Candidatus Binataceae bacterium]|jgi:hypothetical protein